MTSGFRYDRLTGGWVNVAGHRQHRPNLPSDGCPFCVGGLEAPEPYEVRWFENRWPAYGPGEPIEVTRWRGPDGGGDDLIPPVGAAEVVLYSPDHDASLGSMGVDGVRAVVDLWAERTEALMARPEVDYVLVFESRGEEVGATISHPHGQIYGFPFVPPQPAAELVRSAARGACSVCDEVRFEASGGRVVARHGDTYAWVPYASEFPYGVRIASTRHQGGLPDLDEAGLDELATVLSQVLDAYDRLWEAEGEEPDDGERRLVPYLMWIHQLPSDVEPAAHLHVHLAPPERAAGVLRYLAAGEAGSGTLTNPVVPEEAAARLRAIVER